MNDSCGAIKFDGMAGFPGIARRWLPRMHAHRCGVHIKRNLKAHCKNLTDPVLTEVWLMMSAYSPDLFAERQHTLVRPAADGGLGRPDVVDYLNRSLPNSNWTVHQAIGSGCPLYGDLTTNDVECANNCFKDRGIRAARTVDDWLNKMMVFFSERARRAHLDLETDRKDEVVISSAVAESLKRCANEPCLVAERQDAASDVWTVTDNRSGRGYVVKWGTKWCSCLEYVNTRIACAHMRAVAERRGISGLAWAQWAFGEVYWTANYRAAAITMYIPVTGRGGAPDPALAGRVLPPPRPAPRVGGTATTRRGTYGDAPDTGGSRSLRCSRCCTLGHRRNACTAVLHFT